MKRFLNYIKSNPIEIYYLLSFILVCFVVYGIYTCYKVFGCHTLEGWFMA